MYQPSMKDEMKRLEARKAELGCKLALSDDPRRCCTRAWLSYIARGSPRSAYH